MKKNVFIILLSVLFALPIPVAILGSQLSLLWLISTLIRLSSFVEIIMALFGIAVGAIYIFTYLFSLRKTWNEKKISVRTFIPLVHCFIAFVFLLLLILAEKYVSDSQKYFGFSKKDFSVLEEYNTHGGFLGDGEYYLILDCSEDREKALEIVSKWKELPLSENLHFIMYGREKEELGEDAKIPKVENGYYIFKDRHSESKNRQDDSELFNRYSYNFSVAVYDCDTDRMYYYELDT